MNDNMSENSEQILEDARKFFGEDFYATKSTGIQIDEIGEHYAKCSFEITRNHQNAYGGLMGGAIFTLADFAFAIASNFRSVKTVSLSSQITYLSAAKGKHVIAETRLIKDGHSTCCYEINITDDLGTKIALVTITGMKLA